MSAVAAVWSDPANRAGYFRLRRGYPEEAETAKEPMWNYERLLSRVGATNAWITIHVMERCDFQFGNNPYVRVDVDHLVKILRRGRKTILRDLAWLSAEARRILEPDPTRPGYYRAMPENFETGPVLDPPKIPGRPRKANGAMVSRPVNIAAHRQELPGNVLPPVAAAVTTLEPLRPLPPATRDAGNSVAADPDAAKSISVSVAPAVAAEQVGKHISPDAVPCPPCNGTGVVTALRAVEIDFRMSQLPPVIETRNRFSGQGKRISLTGEIGGGEAEIDCPLRGDCRCDMLHLVPRKPLSRTKPTEPPTNEPTEKVEDHDPVRTSEGGSDQERWKEELRQWMSDNLPIGYPLDDAIFAKIVGPLRPELVEQFKQIVLVAVEDSEEVGRLCPSGARRGEPWAGSQGHGGVQWEFLV